MKAYATLTEISYHFGLIGINELNERREVFRWLLDESGEVVDPRLSGEGENEEKGPSNDEDKTERTDRKTRSSDSGGDEGNILELIPTGLSQKWVFTKSDPDSYPSVPHGHLESQNRPWPKLNPYTGRAFARKHMENPRLRLSKPEMRALWCDQKFLDFARSMVMWYMEEFPYHTFPVWHPLRFPKW